MTELDMAPDVAAAVPLRPYVVRVMFEDGEIRDVDIEPVLGGSMFRPLRDPGRFAQVRVAAGHVTWPGDRCEVDLDNEVIYGLYPEDWEPRIRITSPVG